MELSFDRKDGLDSYAMNSICSQLQSFVEQVRANEGMKAAVVRQDDEGGMRLAIWLSDHEQKGAILDTIAKRASRIEKGLIKKGQMAASIVRLAREVLAADKVFVINGLKFPDAARAASRKNMILTERLVRKKTRLSDNGRVLPLFFQDQAAAKRAGLKWVETKKAELPFMGGGADFVGLVGWDWAGVGVSEYSPVVDWWSSET
jgi:hypothetical protein